LSILGTFTATLRPRIFHDHKFKLPHLRKVCRGGGHLATLIAILAQWETARRHRAREKLFGYKNFVGIIA
jgi:hypothetical protein